MQENHKICRIISELTLFILEHISGNINVDIKEEQNKYIIKIVTDEFNLESLNFIKKRLIADRNYSIEEYGWELVGEGDSDDDLELIGSRVDEASIIHENGRTIITLVRGQ